MALFFWILRVRAIWQVFQLQFIIEEPRPDVSKISTTFHDLWVSRNLFSKPEIRQFGVSGTEGLSFDFLNLKSEKDENILVNEETLEARVIDFGCATEFDSDRIYSRRCGTPEFMPPEMLAHTPTYAAESASVWTIGILLYILLIGDIPYDTIEQIRTEKRKHTVSKKL